MSKRLQGFLSARVLVSGLVLVVGLLAVSPAAFACPPSDIEYTYYTTAAKTEQCGWKYITCYCSITSSGCVTPYYDITYWECPFSNSSEAKDEDRPTLGIEAEAGALLEGDNAVCKAP
jgi:uncharacterized protein (DUF427 family)